LSLNLLSGLAWITLSLHCIELVHGVGLGMSNTRSDWIGTEKMNPRCLGLDNFRFNCRITCLVPDDQIQYTFSASIVVQRTEVEATDFGTKQKGKCDWPPREWLVRSE